MENEDREQLKQIIDTGILLSELPREIFLVFFEQMRLERRWEGQ